MNPSPKALVEFRFAAASAEAAFVVRSPSSYFTFLDCRCNSGNGVKRIFERKKQLNRLVELQSKVMVSAPEHAEIQLLQRYFRRYVHNLAKHKQKAQVRATELQS